ncbi:hypothetical protein N0V90_001427 [Kalmusia sp. IMI 367209]|nr:hypothetical protein N0V90_001427 [Kalmusia sp. IMI 367209]
MGGFTVNVLGQPRYAPGDALIEAIRNGDLEHPTIKDPDIDDRSKANWLTKAIVLLQISYFILQLFARAIQHLPISTLELFCHRLRNRNMVSAVELYASRKRVRGRNQQHSTKKQDFTGLFWW